MSRPIKVGGLFAGYGGLELALHAVFPNARPAWFSQYDPDGGKRQAPSRILAHHWPDVPNHGDITKIRWADVEPVDILTGGFPCQDVSPAGKRAGLIRGVTRSGLWGAMATAVEALRPRLVVIENVRGLLSAKANSDVEQCPWCVGGAADGEPALRALGAVLGDLADLGYDAAWVVVPASGVGAPHRRERVFVLAWPQSDPGALLPTPAVRRSAPPVPCSPAPFVSDATDGSSGDLMLPSAVTLLPTPTSTDHKASGATYEATDTHHTGTTLTDATVRQVDRWGQYAPAIARWEALTRPAPAPTEPTGKNGAHRLSPRFVEWMQGLPAGWVTDVPGITRNDMLKALGNGVVPQQAAEAIRWLTATVRDRLEEAA